jgi:hypothetical protein
MRIWACVVAVVIGMGVGAGAGRASICMHCTAGGSCDVGGSAAACLSGKILLTPFCMMWGGCGGGDFSGDGGLVRPRFGATAASGADGASGDALLSLHLMRMPIRVGFDPFPSGSSSFVVRAARESRTARGMLGVIASRAHVTSERIPVCEEAVMLGSGNLEGAFAASDGDGYTLRAEPEGGQLHLRLCHLRGGQPAGSLADVRVREEDVLFVRVRGEGREYALVIAPAVASAADVTTRERHRDARAAFHDEAGPLTDRAPFDGVRFLPTAMMAGGCR